MFCPNCGNQMSDGAIFCANCGWSKKGKKTSTLNKLKIPKLPIAIAGVVISIVVIALLVRFVIFGDGWHGYYYYRNGHKLKYSWVYDNGKWYYLDYDGQRVRSDWKEIKGEYYYFNLDGAMESNKWVKWNGDDYYVDGAGIMLKNTVTPDGYLVDADGKYVNPNKINIINLYVTIKADKRNVIYAKNNWQQQIKVDYKHDCKIDTSGNLYEFERTSHEIDTRGHVSVEEFITIHYLDGSKKKYIHFSEMAANGYYEANNNGNADIAQKEFEKYNSMVDNFNAFYS